MSKKKSTIIDDDPLAWLKDEPSINDGATVIAAATETKKLDAVAEEENKQKSDSKIASEICKDKDVFDEEGSEKNLIKEKTTNVDSNKDVLLAGTEIDTEVESLASNSEESCAVMAEKDEPVLSENNEEDVAMATLNSEKIVLEEDVSIVQVAVLKEAWLSALDTGKDISIDASAVEDIDTAGLQLLLSLVKTVKQSGRTVSWESPSETVINAVKETSLRDALGIEL